ncbi:MAG: hemolysin III family protein [Clostridia bacterium]|nr:hemolysin III family protein [Clostridia bacterium]
MNRTRLRDRQLPDYTKGEEIFNMVSHIVGGGFGVIALVVCVAVAAVHGSVWGIVSSIIYGTSLILLYTMSSVYHGLRPNMGKKVMQVLDHCTIYFLIAGTYTPVALCAIRPRFPGWGWVIFGIVWGVSAVAVVFTAIDLKKYAKFSMACYIGLGWCVVLAVKPTIQSVPMGGLVWLLIGGIAYTVGAVLYGLGRKHRYMHSVFHLFVLLGSICHFISIVGYIL